MPKGREDPAGSAKSQDSVAIYGQSSEGYLIAAKLATKGYKTSIIDENLGTSMELRPDIAADYKDLSSLLADEPALPMLSVKDSISAAKVIFFTPKLRRRDDDILAEVRSRLVEVSRYASSGSLIVFCLPLGTGGANEIISRLEHGMGLICGKDFSFAYSPLELGRPQLFGCESSLSAFEQIIEGSGFSMEVFGLSKAELIHTQRIVSRYSLLSSCFEVAKRLTYMGQESPREYKQIFAEDLTSSFLDLKVVVNSLEAGDPLLYLSSGALKSVESYSRFLVDRIRELVRQKDLKAARLKIILFTDADPYEMRGDKIKMAEDLANRLRDFFSDIEYMNIMREGFTFPMNIDRTNLLVFLSGSCEQKLTQLYEEQIAMTKSHMIRANLPVEFVN
jgi:hypothetical protein